MDQPGFRQLLQQRKLNEAQIETSIALAERFEAYLKEPGRPPSADTAWAFSRQLITEGNNTEANYVALIRYCHFIRNNEMFVALLELVDGGEVGDNLYRRVAERFGPQLRDDVFSGLGVAPYGTPSPDKPAYLQPVIRRLENRVGAAACADFLSASLRDLPDEDFLAEREKFRQTGDLDAYLRQRHAAFVDELKRCRREGRLFFAQPVTAAVLAFVRSDPEMGGGRRQGNMIYETKIPYLTQQYLAENDPVLKRYYACHCPWAREAIKRGNVQLAETFCHCSGGFHKKPWEVILARSLKVEVLESALRGDPRCRFAIHLPEEAWAGK